MSTLADAQVPAVSATLNNSTVEDISSPFEEYAKKDVVFPIGPMRPAHTVPYKTPSATSASAASGAPVMEGSFTLSRRELAEMQAGKGRRALKSELQIRAERELGLGQHGSLFGKDWKGARTGKEKISEEESPMAMLVVEEADDGDTGEPIGVEIDKELTLGLDNMVLWNGTAIQSRRAIPLNDRPTSGDPPE